MLLFAGIFCYENIRIYNQTGGFMNHTSALRYRLVSHGSRTAMFSFLFLILLSQKNLFAEIPYSLSVATETVTLGTGAGLYGLGYYLAQKNHAPSEREIAALDRDDVNPFDRSATRHYSDNADRVSNYFLYTCLAIPVTITLADNWGEWKDAAVIGAMYGEAFLVTQGITGCVKNAVRRKRPYLYNDSVSMREKRNEGSNAKQSFFSGHSSTAFCSAAFITKVYSDMHPDGAGKYIVATGSFAIATSVGFLRYRAGRHYPSDIIVGAAVGSAIGYFIPMMHRKENPIAIIPVTGDRFGLLCSVDF
jgi:membrane-associated phospholipid phosphatase